MEAVAGKRLLSLDILRGITVAGMIVVNNAGGRQSYDYLRHSAWNGLTPCDLVFPFFLFIMGVSTYIALRKFSFRPSPGVVRKVLRRTVLIMLIGWLLHWFDHAVEGEFFTFGHLRLTGVLPRIAICYCIVSFMALYMNRRALVWSAGILLAVYAIMLCTLNGYAPDETNFLNIVDKAVLGTRHLYHKGPVDPEGLASTIPSIAHTLIGFCFGSIVFSKDPLDRKIIRIFVYGFILMSAGCLLTEWLPLNKRIWSPTFVLVTCGLASLLLATLMYFIDMLGKRKWCMFFDVFGVNPLFLYVMSEAVATIAGATGSKKAIYEAIHTAVPDPYLASAVYSTAFALLIGLFGYILYRRHIYIKI